MRRVIAVNALLYVGILLVSLVPAATYAADITDVADAADEIDPFDAVIEVNFRQTASHTLLLRERNVSDVRGGTVPGTSINQGEYDRWTKQNLMDIKIRLGLYRDLEFHMLLPIVITSDDKYVQSSHWRKKYWGGDTLTGVPSLYAEGLTNTVRDTFTAGGHIDDITIGFAWSPFNSERDWSKATWTIYFDMTIPTASLHDPRDLGLSNNISKPHSKEPPLGEKLLTLKLGTAVSKHFTGVDPYVGIFTDIPIPVGDSLIETPQYAFKLMFGSEFIFWEKKVPDTTDARHKIYLELRATNTLFSEGDSYAPLTDLLAWGSVNATNTAPYTLPREESFVRSEGYVALKIQAYDFIRIQGFGTIGHDFDHFIAVQTSRDNQERPQSGEYYRDITEAGKRVKVGQNIFWSWGVGLVLSF